MRFPGLLNFRDLGGTPAAGGRTVRPRRLWRSEVYLALSEESKRAMVAAGLTDVIDLRTAHELAGSPSPLAALPGVAYHHFNYFPDAAADVPRAEAEFWDIDVGTATTDEAANSFLVMLALRPDSVVAALRAIAAASGAALVSCAVGRDRTGLTVALALALAGVADEVIADDYARTGEVVADVVLRQWNDPTYADEAGDLAKLDILPRAEAMLEVLAYFRRDHGGVPALMRTFGWTDADQAALERHLFAP